MDIDTLLLHYMWALIYSAKQAYGPRTVVVLTLTYKSTVLYDYSECIIAVLFGNKRTVTISHSGII